MTTEKGGRPKKEATERRDFVISYRLNATDRARLQAKADKAGLSPNQYACRSALTSQPRINRVIENRFEFEDRHAISRIGNNLFQLKSHLDNGIPIPPSELGEALAEFTAFMKANTPRS